jgi:hypothetical protein
LQVVTESEKSRSQQSLETKVPNSKEKPEALHAIPGVGIGLQMGYLLVSPLQGLVNNLLSMWSLRALGKDSITENEMKLTMDPTLVLFGDNDIFVSCKRLRAWAERLEEAGRERVCSDT